MFCQVSLSSAGCLTRVIPEGLGRSNITATLRISRAKYEDRIDLCIESRVCKHLISCLPSPLPPLTWCLLCCLPWKNTQTTSNDSTSTFSREHHLVLSVLILINKTGPACQPDTSTQSFFPLSSLSPLSSCI